MKPASGLPATVVLAAATMLVACGIPYDREPTITPGGVVMPVLAPSEPPTAGGPPGPSGPQSPAVEVFLVQAENLVAVTRSTARHELAGALLLLLGGPMETEFAAGTRTAISPQTELRSAGLENGTAVVDLSAAFVEVGGQEQILAVAQVVLTATAVPGVERVRFLLEGEAVEVPRADGTLTSDSLQAADYQGLLRLP